MLLSPLTLPESATRRRRIASPRHASRAMAPTHARNVPDSPVPAVLIAWFALGLGVLIIVPAARGSELFGATLPFWLAGAPLLNLAWWTRRAWFAVVPRFRIAARSHRNTLPARRHMPR